MVGQSELREAYERLWPHVEKPGRYAGNERGAVRKDPASVRVRFALAFPEVYEIAQSHLGLQLLYDVLNADGDIARHVERFARATTFPVEQQIKGVLKQLDARPIVSVSQTGTDSLFVETRITREGTIKPHDFVATLLGLSTTDAQLLQVIKVGTTLVDHPGS